MPPPPAGCQWAGGLPSLAQAARPLAVLNLGPMYATDRHQTDRQMWNIA